MRTLKKTLCLVLALVMVLGLCAVNAVAAYSDAAKINYTEAVDVMSAIGVLQGDERGFRPQDTLTRAEASKIIAFMVGAEDLTAKCSFKDVPADHWANSYIAYCEAEGIIAGYGDGNFGPSDTLTGSQFAKMLLCALGYKPENEGISGDAWEVVVAKLVKSTGLALSMAKFDGTKPITREEAAQLGLNTLTATMVEYENSGVNITIGGASISAAASPAKDQTWADARGVNYTTGAASVAGQTIEFCEYYFPTLAQEADIVNGRNGFTWTVKGEEVSDFVTTDIVLKTINSVGRTEAQLTTKGGAYYAGLTPADAVTYYKNGGTGNAADLQTPGVVVDFVDTNYDGKYESVCVTQKSVATLGAAPTVVTKSGKTYVTIPACGVANKLAAAVTGFEGLAKDDVVLYVAMADGTVVIEKAPYFTGTVAGYKSGATGGDLIGGKYYTASVLSGASYTVDTIKSAEVEYNFFTDDSGYIVKAVPTAEAAAANYAVVRKIVWVTPVTDGSIGSLSIPYAQAKLVFTDGTSEVVKVASIDGFKFAAAGTDVAALVTGGTHFVSNASSASITAAASTNAVTGNVAAATYYGVSKSSGGALAGKFYGVANNTHLTAAIPENTFYTYTVNADGSYALSSAMKLGDTTANLANHVVTNGAVAFDGTNTAGANTVFIYVTSDALGQDIYTVYNGIKAAPSTAAAPTNNGVAAIVKSATSGVASYVFVVTSGIQSASTDIIYITSATCTAINGKTPYYVYDAVVNGEVTTIKADANSYGVDFYSVTKIVDDVYTLNATTTSFADDKVGVKGLSGNVLVTGDGTAYTYADGAPAYIIELVGLTWTSTATTVDALALDATDALFVLKKTVGSNTNAEAVYVVKATEAPTALTLAAGAGADAATINVGGGNLLGTTATEVSATESPAANKVKLTWTAAGNTTVKSATVNGAAVTSGTEFALTKGGVHTVVFTIEDDFSKALTAYTYTFTVDYTPAP